MTLRVQTTLTGPAVVGGGVTQLFFGNEAEDAQECVAAVEAFWDELKPQMSDQVTLTIEPEVYEFNQVTGALVAVHPVIAPASDNGDSAGNPLPTSSQGLIKWSTGLVVAGRVLRGRTFLPGMLEANNLPPGVPLGDIVLAAEAAAEALILDGVAEFVVWHRPVAGSGGINYPVTSGALWDKWAVLRSRRD